MLKRARDGTKTLTAPPIGAHPKSPECVRRCESYSYTLAEHGGSTEFDSDLSRADLYLYFSSPEVEAWTEYRLVGGVDLAVGLGGALGLVLGMSLLSLLRMALRLMEKGIRIEKKKSRK